MRLRTLLCLLCLLGSNGHLTGEWQPVPSPSDRLFAFVQGSDNRLFAGSENTGLWISTNGGLSIQVWATGLAEMNFEIRGFYRSEENAASSSRLQDGITKPRGNIR